MEDKDLHEQELEDMVEEIEETKKEMESEEDFKEKYLMALAEMENLRKRLENEKKDFIKYRASSFISEILPTMDMFEQALSAKNVSEETKNWLIGFEMILNNLKNLLANEGVVEIITKVGDDFDGNVHHAFEEKETDQVEPGKILEIKLKGYKIHERLLRPAAVIVAAQGTGE